MDEDFDFTTGLEKVWFETLANPEGVKERIASRMADLKNIVVLTLGAAGQTCTFVDPEFSKDIFALLERFVVKHPEVEVEDD